MAKRYNKEMQLRDARYRAGEERIHVLKLYALKSLKTVSEDFYTEATVNNMNLQPLHQHLPYWTPPHEV